MKPLYPARIVHQTKGRLRFKIDCAKRDFVFFDRIKKALIKEFEMSSIQDNPVTGSLVIKDFSTDIDAVVSFAESKGFFKIEKEENHNFKGPFIGSFTHSIVDRLNNGIKRLTKNQLDISSSVFTLLIIHALREVAKGNLTAPSWFTAIWFASNIYQRDFSSAAGDGGGQHHQDAGADDAHG